MVELFGVRSEKWMTFFYIYLYIKFLIIRKDVDKAPNVNEYPTLRIIYFTILSAWRIQGCQ